MAGAADMRLIVRYFGRMIPMAGSPLEASRALLGHSRLPAVAQMGTIKRSNSTQAALSNSQDAACQPKQGTARLPACLDEPPLTEVELRKFGSVRPCSTNC